MTGAILVVRSRRTHLAAVAGAVVFGLLAALAPAARAAGPDSTAFAAPVPPAPVNPPRLGGYVQFREFTQEKTGLNALINRVRLTVDGALPSRFSYRVMVEYQAPAGAKLPATASLREAYVRWSRAPLVVSGGEFKTPFSREYAIPISELELADLAIAVDSLAPKYDIGVMAEYTLGPTVTLSAGAFNGDGANATVNRDSTSLFAGRAVARVLPQLALGGSVTYEDGDSLRWGVDVNAEHRGATVRAEYLARHVHGRDTGQDDFGWYVFESYRVVPRLQALARQEDFQRPWYGPARRVRGLAWGANFDIAPSRLKLLVEMSRRMSGKQQQHTDTWLAQVQARF
jgi:hypothetical protein